MKTALPPVSLGHIHLSSDDTQETRDAYSRLRDQIHEWLQSVVASGVIPADLPWQNVEPPLRPEE